MNKGSFFKRIVFAHAFLKQLVHIILMGFKLLQDVFCRPNKNTAIP